MAVADTFGSQSNVVIWVAESSVKICKVPKVASNCSTKFDGFGALPAIDAVD